MEKVDKIIFLVDDSPIYLNSGRILLSDKYSVITIPSGEKLLYILQNIKPDLILLDVEMPVMNGYEAIKKVKALPEAAEIPVIFLTGKSDPESELLGLSLGAVDYITKPFSPALLLKRIELHLLLQSQREQLLDFNKNLVEMVKERTNDITKLHNAIITWTAEMVEFRDEETGQHVERVEKYLELLLDAMDKGDYCGAEISSWDKEAFFKSSLLHDVGKIRIRDNILLKKSKLTAEEFTIMKRHALYGRMLLESLQDKVSNQTFLDYGKIVTYSHHERWDGTGYPECLKGDEIPLQARMVALADVYDALVSERSYKSAFSHQEAMEIIGQGCGTQFDPSLTDIFMTLSDSIKRVSNTGSKE